MRRPVRMVAAVIAAATIATAGCSGSADEAEPRVIEVEMTDHRFSPSSIEVEQGEFVIVRFHNRGSVRHEAVIGDAIFQAGHEGHSHMGGEPMVNAVLLEPGASGDVPYRFDTAGEILIGCHEADHWDQGMVATIEVAGSAS